MIDNLLYLVAAGGAATLAAPAALDAIRAKRAAQAAQGAEEEAAPFRDTDPATLEKAAVLSVIEPTPLRIPKEAVNPLIVRRYERLLAAMRMDDAGKVYRYKGQLVDVGVKPPETEEECVAALAALRDW